MNAEAAHSDRLWALINAHCNGVTTDEEQCDLEGLLRDDSRARQLYFNACQMHTELFAMVRVDKAFDAVAQQIVESTSPAGQAGTISGLLSSHSGALPIPPVQPSILHVPSSNQRSWISRSQVLWVLAAMLINVVVVAVVMFLVSPRASMPHGRIENIASHGNPSENGQATNLTKVATLTEMQGCQWQVEPQRPALSDWKIGDRLSEGQRLHLVKGLAEIKFDDGARILLEGPADCVLETASRGTLHSGRVVALVPPAARGFTVATPTLTIVDLGTEFGVEVNRSGATEVQVFQGNVEAVIPASGERSAKTFRLSGSQRVRFEDGKYEQLPTNAGADRFVRNLPKTDINKTAVNADKAHERWRAHSEELRKDSDLVAYYTFDDQPHGAVLHNHAMGNPQADRFNGTINGKVEARWQTGRFSHKSALKFNGLGDKVTFEQGADKFGLHDSFTVATWIWPIYTSLMDLAIVGDVSRPTDNRSFHLVLRKDWRMQDKVLSGREQYFAHLGFWHSDAESLRAVPAGKWTLVVFRYDRKLEGGTQSIFVNGEDATEKPASAKPPFAGTQLLQLGSAFDDGERYFCGLMDEVAFFKRVLTADEIEAMYEAGKPQ